MGKALRVTLVLASVFLLASLLSQVSVGEANLAYVGPTQHVYLPLIVKPAPKLYVGMSAQWDGTGNIRLTDASYDVGSHLTRNGVAMTDADTLQVDSHRWYSPNPLGWAEEYWSSYYSVSTGQLKSSSAPPDPDWKWGAYWFLPFNVEPANGGITNLNGQAMNVSGPFSGYTAYGQSVTYWQMVNRDRILYWWDGASRWKQYVEPGDATLRYIATGSRLLMYSDIKRTYYLDDGKTSQYVRYIDQLTSTNVPVDSLAQSERRQSALIVTVPIRVTTDAEPTWEPPFR